MQVKTGTWGSRDDSLQHLGAHDSSKIAAGATAFRSRGWNYFDLLCLACAYADIVVTALLQKLVLRGFSQGVWPGMNI